MRYAVITALFSILASAGCLAAEEVPQIGDKGFMHSPELHSLYQTFFGKEKCHCSAGQCRPSDWRRVLKPDEKDPVIQVWVNRGWCDVKESVLLKEYKIPPEVWAKLVQLGYKAHVCAYTSSPGYCPSIECVVVTSDS